MQTEQKLIWTEPSWVTEAHAWIRLQLNRLQIEITGEIDQFHIYPWSTVMRVPTKGVPVYFKAVAPLLAYEPALTQMLADRVPEIMPPVLAVEQEKAWMLTADMGITLRVYLRASRDLRLLLHTLPRFAELQIEMIPHADELAGLGVPVHTLEQIAAGYETIIQDTALLSSSEYALTPHQQSRLHSLQPAVLQMVESIDAAGLPLTLHHDDFHDANIFIREDRLIFSDWGDCVVTHPFFSLLILLRSVSDSMEVTEDSAQMLSLRDAYLAPWAAFTGRDDLVQLFQQTWRLGMLNRALSWYHFIAMLNEPYRTRYAYTVPGWLGDFLETMDAGQTQ